MAGIKNTITTESDKWRSVENRAYAKHRQICEDEKEEQSHVESKQQRYEWLVICSGADKHR